MFVDGKNNINKEKPTSYKVNLDNYDDIEKYMSSEKLTEVSPELVGFFSVIYMIREHRLVEYTVDGYLKEEETGIQYYDIVLGYKPKELSDTMKSIIHEVYGRLLLVTPVELIHYRDMIVKTAFLNYFRKPNPIIGKPKRKRIAVEKLTVSPVSGEVHYKTFKQAIITRSINIESEFKVNAKSELVKYILEGEI